MSTPKTSKIVSYNLRLDVQDAITRKARAARRSRSAWLNEHLAPLVAAGIPSIVLAPPPHSRDTHDTPMNWREHIRPATEPHPAQPPPPPGASQKPQPAPQKPLTRGTVAKLNSAIRPMR
jgi:hypothetical protein